MTSNPPRGRSSIPGQYLDQLEARIRELEEQYKSMTYLLASIIISQGGRLEIPKLVISQVHPKGEIFSEHNYERDSIMFAYRGPRK